MSPRAVPRREEPPPPTTIVPPTETRLSAGMLVRQVVAYAPGVIAPAAIGLLSATVFTRLLTSGSYGRYSLALSSSTLIASLCSQWLVQGITRYLPSERERVGVTRLKAVIAASLAAVAALLAVLGIAVVLIAPVQRGSEWDRILLPALLLTVATALTTGLGAVLQSEMQARRYSLYQVVSIVARFVAALALVTLVRAESSSLLWGAALGMLVVLPPMWAAADMPALRGVLADARRLLRSAGGIARYGLPMAGWVTCAALLDAGDRYVISLLRGPAEVGIYAANYALVIGGVGLVSTPVLLAAHPFLMRAWGTGDRAEAARWLGIIAEWFAIAGVLLVGVIALFARDLATLLLGPEFREGYRIIPVVLGGSIAWQLGMYAHKPLEFAERTRLLFGLSVVAAVVNLALNFLLVPRFGYLGAAYATLLAYVLYMAITSVVGRRLLRWRVGGLRLARAVAVTAVGIGSAYLVRQVAEREVGYAAGLVVAMALSAATALLVTLPSLRVLIGGLRARGSR